MGADLQPRRVEQTYVYPADLRARYIDGSLFQEWWERYEGALLFCPKMRTSRQVPHSGPIKTPMFFNELYLGTQYLDAGFGALFFYRQAEDEAGYRMACDVLGGDAAAQAITPNSERGGRAPDLLVYDRATLQFRFIECKARSEAFTPSQLRRFAEIETYLNGVLPSEATPLTEPRLQELFPTLRPGEWIHVARLVPSPS